MNSRSSSIPRIVILADESACWKIAGLQQLDRIALALNEVFGIGNDGGSPRICIFWRPSIPIERRQSPRDSRLAFFDLTSGFEEMVREESPVLLLSTRLFMMRSTVGSLLSVAPSMPRLSPQHKGDHFWQLCLEQCEKVFHSGQNLDRDQTGWRYLIDPSDAFRCERLLLRKSGKPQDGWVSRFINRPLTRPITRLLLTLPITPSTWTLLIAILPIAGALTILRGSYGGFVWGMICYQIYSMLDGCDGEVARAKYLESEKGRKLDSWCDFLSNLLLMVAIGIGLSRASWIETGSAKLYLLEGILAAFLTTANEALLMRRSAFEADPDLLGGMLYPRHRDMVRGSGILFLGENIAGGIIQMTKRDVAIFAFLIIAIIGQPQWILHLCCAFGFVSLTLAAKSLIRRRAADAS